MILKRVIKSFYFLHLIIIFLSLSYLNAAVRHIVPEKTDFVICIFLRFYVSYCLLFASSYF